MRSVDLMHGVIPISRAASSLAQLIQRANTHNIPIVITQKGYPSGVVLSINYYTDLCRQAQANGQVDVNTTVTNEPA